MTYSDPSQQKQAQQEFYRKNKKSYTAKNRERRQERRKWFDELTKDDKCEFCGESEKCCLDYHHRDPNTKHTEVSRLLNEFRSKDKIIEELAKCICVCANCHRKIHAGKLGVAQRQRA